MATTGTARAQSSPTNKYATDRSIQFSHKTVTHHEVIDTMRVLGFEEGAAGNRAFAIALGAGEQTVRRWQKPQGQGADKGGSEVEHPGMWRLACYNLAILRGKESELKRLYREYDVGNSTTDRYLKVATGIPVQG